MEFISILKWALDGVLPGSPHSTAPTAPPVAGAAGSWAPAASPPSSVEEMIWLVVEPIYGIHH